MPALQAADHLSANAARRYCSTFFSKCDRRKGQTPHGIPVSEPFAQGGKVHENGRMVHDLHLFEVRKPSESKKPWDYYRQLAAAPGDKAFLSARDSGCPATK